MKFLSLFVALLLLVAIDMRAEVIEYPEQGITFELTMERFAPPLVIVEGQVDDWPRAPVWWPAYDALKNFRDGRKYAEWEKYFSPDWIERRKLNKKVFERARHQPPTTFSNPPVQSALFQAEVVWGERHIIVVKFVNKRVEECPDDLKDLDARITTQVFEQAPDGIWQNQTPQAVGFVMEIPYNHPVEIDAIIQAGCVTYNHGMRARVAPVGNDGA